MQRPASLVSHVAPADLPDAPRAITGWTKLRFTFDLITGETNRPIGAAHPAGIA